MLVRQQLFVPLPSKASFSVADSHGRAKLMELCFVNERDTQYRSHQEVNNAVLPHVFKLKLILFICIYLSLHTGNKQKITPEQSNDSIGRAHKRHPEPSSLSSQSLEGRAEPQFLPFMWLYKERKGHGEQERGKKEQLCSLP